MRLHLPVKRSILGVLPPPTSLSPPAYAQTWTKMFCQCLTRRNPPQHLPVLRTSVPTPTFPLCWENNAKSATSVGTEPALSRPGPLLECPGQCLLFLVLGLWCCTRGPGRAESGHPGCGAPAVFRSPHFHHSSMQTRSTVSLHKENAFCVHFLHPYMPQLSPLVELQKRCCPPPLNTPACVTAHTRLLQHRVHLTRRVWAQQFMGQS